MSATLFTESIYSIRSVKTWTGQHSIRVFGGDPRPILYARYRFFGLQTTAPLCTDEHLNRPVILLQHQRFTNTLFRVIDPLSGAIIGSLSQSSPSDVWHIQGDRGQDIALIRHGILSEQVTTTTLPRDPAKPADELSQLDPEVIANLPTGEHTITELPESVRTLLRSAGIDLSARIDTIRVDRAQDPQRYDQIVQEMKAHSGKTHVTVSHSPIQIKTNIRIGPLRHPSELPYLITSKNEPVGTITRNTHGALRVDCSRDTDRTLDRRLAIAAGVLIARG